MQQESYHYTRRTCPPRRRRRSLSFAVDWKGISGATIFDAGVRVLPNGDVRVPYRWPDGSEHNAKVFPASGEPKCRWQHPGREMIPFGVDLIGRGFAALAQTIILAEGESDTLALRDRYAVDGDGHPIVMLGLPGATSWRKCWGEYLLPARRVYVVGDGDAAGRRMANLVLRDVPHAGVVLMPPREDARSILQGAKPERFDALLDDADRVLRLGRRMGLYGDAGGWAT